MILIASLICNSLLYVTEDNTTYTIGNDIEDVIKSLSDSLTID